MSLTPLCATPTIAGRQGNRAQHLGTGVIRTCTLYAPGQLRPAVTHFKTSTSERSNHTSVGLENRQIWVSPGTNSRIPFICLFQNAAVRR